MNILHVSAWHSCFSVGGTEVYIDSLCAGIEAVDPKTCNCFLVITPKDNQLSIPDNVKTITNHENEELLSGKIEEVIAEFKPNIICLHTVVYCEYLVALIGKKHNIPYFYFHHASAWICFQRNFKFIDKFSCTNFSSPNKCAICMRAKKHGLFKAVIKQFIDICTKPKRKGTAWGWYHFTKTYTPKKVQCLQNATKCIVFTEYDRNIFLKNQIKAENIELIPQGLEHNRLQECKVNLARKRHGELNIGYVGRIDPIKGCDILVEAAQKTDENLPLRLHMYGCNIEEDYRKKLETLAMNHKNIIFHAPLSPKEIISVYGGLDVLCIPSIVHETGPLTLLEGVYSGCMVAGSNNVGHISVLKKYGEIIKNNSVLEWRNFFIRYIDQKEILRNKERANIEDDWDMVNISKKIYSIFEEALNG